MVLDDQIRYLHLSVHHIHLLLEVPLQLIHVLLTWALQMRNRLNWSTLVVDTVKLIVLRIFLDKLLNWLIALINRGKELRNRISKFLESGLSRLKLVNVFVDQSKLLFYSQKYKEHIIIMNQATILAINILELLDDYSESTLILKRSKLSIKHFLETVESLSYLLSRKSLLLLLFLLSHLVLFIHLSKLTKHLHFSLH